MTSRPLRSLAIALAASSASCSAFAPPTPLNSQHRAPFVSAESSSRRAPRPLVALGESESAEGEGEEKAVECYITNEEEVLTEGEKPEVVCTSEPEEFAWMEGIDPDKLVKTDGVEGMTECVEGASPKGTPEWKCE